MIDCSIVAIWVYWHHSIEFFDSKKNEHKLKKKNKYKVTKEHLEHFLKRKQQKKMNNTNSDCFGVW